MSRSRVIGIDPGPTPGLVELVYVDRRLVDVIVVQCSANVAVPVFTALMTERSSMDWDTFIQVEQFVVGRRAGRSSTPQAGAQTRALIGALQHEALTLGALCVLRNAVTAKAWATDTRLAAAGLVARTKGMSHARDAARHALYAASNSASLPDPLSKEWSAA